MGFSFVVISCSVFVMQGAFQHIVTTVTILAPTATRSDYRRKIMAKSLLAFTVLFLSSSVCAAELSADRVGEIIGVKATTTPDGVVRVAWPRKEVQVDVDGLVM